jgi:YVTN family beta-propeller protein
VSTTGALTGTIAVGTGTFDGEEPLNELAVTPDGGELYLAAWSQGLPADVTVIDTATQAVGTITVGGDPSDVEIAG